MLRLIRIRNLALIRELEIEFGNGLNLLTGETGSGKSILVDALGLLLGARSSQEMIRSDCGTAVIEGVFEIDPGGSVAAKLAECGFESDDNTVLIRREISASGRNRAYINSNLANVSLLKAVGERLADIHGQQEQRSLLELATHLEWLDHFGGNEALLKKVRDSYRRVAGIASQLQSLEMNEQERLRRIDVLQFQIAEIQGVNPKPGEKEALEAERDFLSNREKILSLAGDMYATLYESESSVLAGINRIERLLDQLEGYDSQWGTHREALQDCRYKLEDVAYAARDYASRTDFNPERLEQVEQRLFGLEKLTRKYGASSNDIIEYQERCSRELDGLLSYAESSTRLAEELKRQLSVYSELAHELSQKRHRAAERLVQDIRKEFAALAMERMQLQVEFKPNRDEGDGERIPAFYGLDGIDHVEFLIAPNKGEEMKPLAKIASGGELSRLMLSIKSLCGGEEKGRTLVFDEVDAGIGGRAAEAVGKRLKDISTENQVLCVTHLPQIAAFALHHFNVHKKVVGGRTETVVRRLNDQERIQELSRMLGGENITAATRGFAEELLEHSAELHNKEVK